MKLGKILRFALDETYTILAVLGTFLTVTALIDFNELFPELGTRAVCIVLMFAVSYVIGILKVLFTTKHSVDLGNGRSAVLEFGDLFEKEDQIVIPVNDCFDTLVDDVLISGKSIHGQFIQKYFGGNTAELDRLIDQQLQNVPAAGQYQAGEKRGKLPYYPPGTVVTVSVRGKEFYLVALTHFSGNVVQPDLKMYYLAVLALLEHLNQRASGRTVYMPFLGAGLARLGRDKDTELNHLLCILKMSSVNITGDIHIVLHSSMRDKIHLSRF